MAAQRCMATWGICSRILLGVFISSIGRLMSQTVTMGKHLGTHSVHKTTLFLVDSAARHRYNKPVLALNSAYQLRMLQQTCVEHTISRPHC